MEIKLDFDARLLELGVIITIVFIVLKLTGVVSWSWFLCFLPLIISAAITFLFVSIMLLVMLVMFCKYRRKSRKI